MPSALVPLANITLGSTASTVTFSSIGQGYRDLMLVIGNLNSSGANTSMFVRFNSDTSASYSAVRMYGNGGSPGSYSSSGDTFISLTDNFSISSTSSANFVINIMDYSATNKHKSTLVRYATPNSGTEADAYRWANTSAITTILLTSFANPAWAAGTTFALYGVSA